MVTISKTDKTFSIRTATLEDMSFILSLAAKECWNPGLEDGGPFFAMDPSGFFIGEINGEPIGCISAVNYGSDFGFLGLYIVKPEYRHMGYGFQLWKKAINHFGDRLIGLDGVVDQQENYKKSGFRLYYRNIRFEGRGNNSKPKGLVTLAEVPFETLLEYDTSIFGWSRKAFLEKWVRMTNASFLGILDKNRIVGYGVIRSCQKGWKIGPLFADDEKKALSLYQGLCSKADNAPVFLDVPEINANALKIAERFNMKRVFETARMYTKDPGHKNLEKVFGVSSFELG